MPDNSPTTIPQTAVITALVLLFCLIPPLYGDDYSGKILKIQNVEYAIKGRTSEKALNEELKWDFGLFFSSPYELDSYLQQKRQQLINKKVFKSVLTSYEINKVEELIVSVDVHVTIEDSWTLLPLPYYNYDDNLGFVLGFNFEYKNLNGTLTNLLIKSFYSDIKSLISTQWTDFRIGNYLFDVHYDQLWETIQTADKSGEINLKYSYRQSMMSVSMKLHILDELQYTVRPTVRLPYSYTFYSNRTDEKNEYFESASFIPGYNHMIEWNSVNWIGSFRQGINASIENQIEYEHLKTQMIYWVDGIFKSYIYTPFVSINTRVSAFYYHNEFRKYAGDRIRGILDYKLNGERGYFINQNFPFELFSIKEAGVMQMSPFFDLGAVYGESQNQGLDGLQYTAGCSFIFFPAFLSSFSVNVNIGVNLRDTSEKEIGFSSHLYF